MFAPEDLFDLSQTAHATLFTGLNQSWEALRLLDAYLHSNLKPALHNRCEGRAYIGDQVFIGEGSIVEDGAMIKGPAIIGRNCQVRHNAYIRENVIIGDHCVVGNSCELKNSILFNHCQVPHFNYVGDSILGHKAHLGAGVILSNVRLVPGNVTVSHDGKRIDSGLRKFGALIGDHAEIGCNSVLNPGSIIGRNGIIYPTTNWRGTLPPHTIARHRTQIELITRKS